ncbi:MAG TPA: PfkB family carbohydrate kinase [Candidatus Wallbacteria bacterium]|nr:PfkB family carbohydrate kinase [Candidatus Wallbacteria bacterium]
MPSDNGKNLFKIQKRREKEYFKILDSLKNVKVAVVGDIIADEYITGACERISREAPVLILRHESSKTTPGGAGNATANAASLGAEVYSIGAADKSREAEAVIDFYIKNGINSNFIVRGGDYKTCVKTRIMSGALHTTLQQVIRIDKGGDVPISDETADKILANFKKAVKKVDSVLISDYNCGLFTDYFCARLQDILNSEYSKRDILVIVDSRHRLFDFKGAYTATPNESEALEASGIKIKNRESLIECGRKLIKMSGDKTMLITRGSAGMAFFDESGALFEVDITRRDEIADVTGAGDTVAAMLAASLPITRKMKKPELSIELANIAGGVKVMKRGTAQVTNAEVRTEIERILKNS